MSILSLFLLAILANAPGITHAKTDWPTITPDSDLNTTMVVYTVLATVVTIVQFLHCFAAVVGMEAGLGKRTFTVLFPGLMSLLALYILRSYFLTHYNNSPAHLSRAIYAMLYFTEQFSNILIATSTMALLYWTERDWYKNKIILATRKDHNALLTIDLYQHKLTHAIIGFYNVVTIDISISSFVLWIYGRKYRESEAEKDQRTNSLLLITPLLAIRSLLLLVVHVLSLVSIPPHLVNTIWTVIYGGWLMLNPTLCYAALYTLLLVSGAEPPIRFRHIALACWAIIVACFSCVTAMERAMPRTETETVWVPQDPMFAPPEWKDG
ncbi:hypothetical protein B0H13DRAFT_2324354 [Mycena leptocephala]|nr:hypothetical protein B0H13DRAFT_2324354 [Mycena leptocephala]